MSDCPHNENNSDYCVICLRARVAELESEIKTHFEHGWSRGFNAGSNQANTLPSDWRGYQAILKYEQKNKQALKQKDDE